MSNLHIDALRFKHWGPIQLEIEGGQCVGVAGPSGSGKSLMLRALADLDAHEGKVSLDGAESSSMNAPAWRRMVALLPAESQWWNDIVGAHFPSHDPGGLSALGFESDVMTWPVSRLSSGERQRLALLRMLAHRPQALLLDEPTAALDGANVERVESLIADYRRKIDAPVLWVTHDASQLQRVADRHFRMSGGQLLEEAPE